MTVEESHAHLLKEEPESWLDNEKIIQKAVEQGYKVCVWPSHIHEKDINDMVVNGMDPVDIKQIIDTNTHQGLKAKLAITAGKL